MSDHLRISADSWHYRMRSEFFAKDSKDLCSYFWSCVAAAMGWGIAYGAAFFATILRPLGPVGAWIKRHGSTLLLLLLVAGAGLVISSLVIAIIRDPWNALWIPLTIIGTLLAFGLLLALIIGAAEFSDRRRKTAGKNGKIAVVKEKQGDSTAKIFWAFLRAKKQKVCPLIEVVNDFTDLDGPDGPHGRPTV